MSLQGSLRGAQLIKSRAFTRKTGLSAPVELTTEEQWKLALEAIIRLERRVDELERKLNENLYGNRRVR